MPEHIESGEPLSKPDDTTMELPADRRRHGRRRRRGMVLLAATCALLAALFVGFGRQLWPAATTTTSLTRPAAASGAGQAAVPGSAYGYGLNNGSGSSSGSSSLSGSSPTSSSSSSISSAKVNSIAAKVDDALVYINVKDKYTGSAGAATGIVLSSSGLVLTNNHVIDGATSISATDVGNGQTYSATVVGYDATHDIALIQLKGASGLATAALGGSSSLTVGDTVVAIGNANGDGGTADSTGGTVTALHRQIVATDQSTGTSERLSGLIQTDADIVSGDSGGALVTTDGDVIGVITAGSSGSYSFSSSTSTGFAVPIDTAMKIAGQITAGTSSSTVHIGATAFLGVELSSASDESSSASGGGGYGGGYYGGQSESSSSGATVAGVLSGSPAAKAGLSAGDVIVSVGGKTVASADDLSDLLSSHHPGDKVRIAWTDQSGARHATTVTLIAGPAK